MLVSKNTLFLAYKSNLLTKCIELFIFENISLSRMAGRKWVSEFHEKKNKQKHLPRINTEGKHCIQSRMRKRRLHSSLGAKSKGSNGGVAVGLPHRNSSVLKQADANKW